VDARVIAATNKDLNEEVKKGNFRKDLYYRLNVLPIRLMPLRERKGDIPLLSQYFMERIASKLKKKSILINDETMRAFLEYEWPGNIRELENLIELMVNTESLPESFMKSMPDNHIRANSDYPLKSQGSGESEIAEEILNLELMEKMYILKALNRYDGNISLCAKTLGIGRNTLYRKIEYYGIKCSEAERVSSYMA
jgi:transcriptional regulator with PAS, ATPase and Fis domain